MEYTSPQPTGIIPAHSTVEVPLVITPQALEEIDAVAEFSIFGSVEPPQVRNMAQYVKNFSEKLQHNAILSWIFSKPQSEFFRSDKMLT